MKSVMKHVSLIVFSLFALVVFALMMSFSFSGLGRVYPNNMLNQAMGLVLFDIGALVWMITFIWKAEGGFQRAGAFVCFVLDFLGSLGLVAIEVFLGGQTYVAVAPWVGQSLIYIFIGATIFNVAGVFFHHFTEPGVQDEIENQSLVDDLKAEARRQANENNQVDMQSVGQQLAQRARNGVRAKLGLPTLAEDLFGAPVGPARPLPVPASTNAPTRPQNPTP